MASSTRSEDPRPARKRARFAEILSAAWEVATEDGLSALSMSEVARRVGLRQPSLYAYVDSKMSLYDAMFAQAARSLMDHVTSLTYPDDPRQAVRELDRAFLDWGLRPRNRAARELLFARTIPGFEPSSDSYAIAQQFSAFSGEKLAAAGVTDPADIDIYVALIGGLGSTQIANEPTTDRWIRHLDTVLDMFFDHIDDKAGPNPPRDTRPTVAPSGRPASPTERGQNTHRQGAAPR